MSAETLTLDQAREQYGDLKPRARHIGQGRWRIELWPPAPVGMVAVSARLYDSMIEARAAITKADYNRLEKQQ